ncbi:WXG100 family type VII secretion target [Nocardia sp. NPDC088792]|uniref:WXG100 family type VII secretion target n=1 Tax=Nocardia sp. NPDC088792 TaxID=3364332 RepID=UPI0038242BEC
MVTPTISQVKAWDPEVLNTQATEWDTKAQSLGNTLDAAARSVDGSSHYWIGTAGDSMRDRHDEIHGNATTIKTALENGVTAARNGATAIQAAKTALLKQVTTAEDAHFTVSDTGEVKMSTDMLLLMRLTDLKSAQTLEAGLQSRAEDYQKAIQAALTDCGTADDQAMTAVNNAFANLTTTQVDPLAVIPPDQLTPDQARKDLQAVKDGTADADTLARIHAATTLSDDDKQKLDNGASDTVGLAQFPYLQAFTQGMNGMSGEDIDKLGGKLPGNGPDQVKSDIANDFRVISDPRINSLDGKDTGGMKQLPDNVQKMVTENPSLLAKEPEGHFVAGDNWMPADPQAVNAYNAKKDNYRALADLMSKGDTTIQGSDINRGMIKQGAELAALNTDPKSDTSKIANAFLSNAADDHTAVRDALTNPKGVMDVTCTPGGHYDANSHVVDILQHQWNSDQTGAMKMVSWIGDDAGSTNQFLQQRAGESAQALANIVSHNQGALSHDIPGYPGHLSFGQLNPDLSMAVAKSLEPYIPNLAGASEPDLLVNHYCGHLDTAGSYHDSPGSVHTPGDLSNLFKVIDSNPHAAIEFNNAAAHLAGQLDFKAGAGNEYAAYQQAQLTGAMQIGLNDEIVDLTGTDHQKNLDNATASYNSKAEVADIVTGILNGAGLAGPEGGAVSTAAWILDPVIKAQIPQPDAYEINQTTTHWNSDLAPVTGVTTSDTLYQDVNIIRGYDSVHHGTLEQFQNYEHDGRTYHFIDSQGQPNLEAINAHRNIYEQAVNDLMSHPLDDYDREHRRGWVNSQIMDYDPEDGTK